MPEPRRRQAKPDKRRGRARREHGARPRKQDGELKPPTGQEDLASRAPAEQPEGMESAASRIAPPDLLADDAGLALVDQTFTPDEGEREATDQQGA